MSIQIIYSKKKIILNKKYYLLYTNNGSYLKMYFPSIQDNLFPVSHFFNDFNTGRKSRKKKHVTTR